MGAQAMTGPAMLSGPRLVRSAFIEKIRSLPVGGEVRVRPGDVVSPRTVVAHLNPGGYLHFVNVARELDVSYNLAEGCLTKREGDAVSRGEVIAARPAALGFLLAECRSPADGVIEKVYPSGHLTIRSHPIPVEAFVGGLVVETVPGEMVAILTRGTLIQGVFGQGGERHGPLALVGEGAAGLPKGMAPGAVVVTFEPVRPGLVGACLEAKAAALVAPSAHLNDLPADRPLAVVLTEGFGSVPMTGSVRAALAALEGREASISGITQLRAGVERPEVIIPHGPAPSGRPAWSPLRLGRRTVVYGPSLGVTPGLAVGARVRCVRAPHFGLEGSVVDLPAAPQRIATGATLPVAVTRLDDGREVVVPVCNLEVSELGGEPAEGGTGR